MIDKMKAEYYKALALIRKERNRQVDKFGEQHHDFNLWMSILLEEIGEACKDALHDRYEECFKELIEVSAVAVAILEDFISKNKDLYNKFVK